MLLPKATEVNNHSRDKRRGERKDEVQDNKHLKEVTESQLIFYFAVCLISIIKKYSVQLIFFLLM